MNSLRAYAYLCWLLAALGAVAAVDGRSSSPGGVFASWPTYRALYVVGLLVASVFSVLAVGLHVAEFFAVGKERRKRFSDALEGWPTREGGS